MKEEHRHPGVLKWSNILSVAVALAGKGGGARFHSEEPTPMSWKLLLRQIWRGLCALASVFSIGRLFSGVLDMLDSLDP